MRHGLLYFIATGILFGQGSDIAGTRIRPHLKFLSSDLLEGRGVGTRGGELATNYIASQFEAAGLKPAGDNGTYFQRVSLVGVEPGATSTLSAVQDGKQIPFRWLEDFVGNSQQQKAVSAFDAEAVFVGHGITAPEFGWSDYDGVDVKGKVVVLFTNEPPSDDDKFFEGKALTYYGRWTYKYEEATRRGAIACIILHTTPTAGYNWSVVRGSWGKEDPQVKLNPGEQAMALAGWVTEAGANQLLSLAGKNVAQLLEAANTKGFKAMQLGFRVKGSMNAKIRSIETANVAGIVPGSDPAVQSEALIFSAHWDHLGISVPVNGDSIYNGAVDNASGCAMLIEMARAWSTLSRKPKRSALFLAVTAEESGLRGAEYYSKHPLLPVAKTLLNLNFDSFYPFGRVKDVVVTGAEKTKFYPQVQETARRFNLKITPDPEPEQGHYFRSDHFAFAKVGIPAFSVNMGHEYEGKPANFGSTIFAQYNEKNYHNPSDEYKDDWDFAGIEQIARFGFTIGLNVANR